MQGFTFILMFALLIAPAAAAEREQPRARAGAIDLSDWDFARDGIVDLAGEWEIAWGGFEDPAAPPADATSRGRIAVPGPWNDAAVPGKAPGAFGHATYRLNVDCRARGRLALVLPIQHSALRLYVNGRISAVQGSPGGLRELARPAFVQQIASLEEAACPLQIVAHVSNYEMRNGGLLRAIELGDAREVQARRERGLARDLFSLGGVMVLSVLAILFWLWRREDKAPLWLGVYGLSSSIFIAVGGERVAQPLIAPLGWEASWKIVLVSMMLGLAAFPSFVRALYAPYFPRLAHRALLAPLALLALLILLTPARVYTQAVPLIYALWIVVAGGCVTVLVRAALGGQRGAWLLLAGFAILTATGVHDTVQVSYQIANKLTPYGLFAFLVAPALLLARRFARALRAEELRSVEQQNRADLLVHATQAGLLDWDATANVTTYSDRFKEMLGYAAGTDASKWPPLFDFIHPEDRERVRASFLGQLRDHSTPSSMRTSHDPADYRLRRADGSYLWIHAEAISLTGADGRTLRYICSFIDISQHKQLEAELSDRAKFTNDLFESVPVQLAMRDTQGRTMYVNQIWERNTGFTRESVIGKTPQEFRTPADAAANLEMDRAAFEHHAAGTPGPLPPEERTIQGRRFLQTRSVVSDSKGRPVGVIIATVDMTDRHAMEERLREQIALTQAIVAQAPNSIFAKDREGRFTLANRGWSEMSGVPAEQAIGRTVHDLYPAAAAKRFAEEDEKLLAQGAAAPPVESLHTGPRPDQYRIVRKAVLSRDGEVLGLVCSSTDISALKRMEQELALERDRLELLVRATKSGFMDWDAATDVRAYSSRFKEMLGYPPDADTSAWPSLFEMMHPEDRAPMRDAFREMLREGAATGERIHGPLEYRLRKTDGSYVWVRGEGIAKLGADGRTERFLTSYIDITHLREMNLALEESVRLREEVDRISRHDLKTPLNSIIGIPRLLRDSGRLSAEDGELLAFVEQAGYRLLNMVNLSLDMFQMERGSYPFTPKSIDLRDVLGKVVRDLEQHARAKHVTLRIEGPALHALAEELLCYSLFANLAKNAVEASPEGGTVGFVLAGNGDAVLVRVHNAGAVPETVRTRFFDKYSSAGKQGGSGLGTYSARLMARTQRGEVEMETSEAVGTTISVRLIKAPTPETESKTTKSEPQDISTILQPLSVLVVDDDEYTRVFVQRFLPAAMRTRGALNGREAVESVRQDPPDAIIMDLDMPVMGGLEAAALIRQWEAESGRARCAMIAMSSHDDPAVATRCGQAGFDRFLAKPVSPDSLRRTLSELSFSKETVSVDPDLRDALPGFLASRREMVDALARAVAAGMAEPARALAHKLAGSFALYGFHWAAGRGKMIEKRAQENSLDGLAAEVDALRRHLEDVQVGTERKKLAEEQE